MINRESFMQPSGRVALTLAAIFSFNLLYSTAAETPAAPASAEVRDYHFDQTISRQVLENYLSRSISMEGMFNGRGDLDDNIRMLTSIRAKYIGRSLCLWGAEADLFGADACEHPEDRKST